MWKFIDGCVLDSVCIPKVHQTGTKKKGSKSLEKKISLQYFKQMIDAHVGTLIPHSCHQKHVLIKKKLENHKLL